MDFWLCYFGCYFFSYSWAYARTLQRNQDYDFMIFGSDFSLHFYIHLEICRSALQSSEFLQYRNLVFIGSLCPEGLLTSGKDDRLMPEVMISPWPAKQSIQVQMSVGYPCETLKGGGNWKRFHQQSLSPLSACFYRLFLVHCVFLWMEK